ncbi:MAG: hypothetical protein IH818_11545 [Acidobacteria bacterium]|nr:hypothetical protein [Acidobacteriota bacterium]
MGADYARLGDEVKKLEQPGVDRIRWDVTDVTFVPVVTFGVAIVAACRTTVNLPFEPRLMVAQRHIGRLTQADYQTIIVHAEATSDIGSVINPPVDLSTPPIKPHQADRMTQ